MSKNRKLGRRHNPRQTLFRALMRGLILHGKIRTTKARAKAIQPEMDKIMTLVKKDSVASRRLVLAKLGGDRESLSLLFEKYMPLAKSRNSGFTRLMLMERRRGDSAEMVSLELIEVVVAKKPGVKKAKKAAKTKTTKKTRIKKVAKK